MAQKDEEAEAMHLAILEEAYQHALEETKWEEDSHWPGLEEALHLSTAGDCEYPPRSPPPQVQPKPDHTSIAPTATVTYQ